jgi:hypothetical protein
LVLAAPERYRFRYGMAEQAVDEVVLREFQQSALLEARKQNVVMVGATGPSPGPCSTHRTLCSPRLARLSPHQVLGRRRWRWS